MLPAQRLGELFNVLVRKAKRRPAMLTGLLTPIEKRSAQCQNLSVFIRGQFI